MLKSVMSRSALIVLACSLSLAAHAIADGTKRPIHIPPGELATALDLLAKQSGADLVYRPEQVQGLKTRGVDGELSTEEAVTRLLEGTALILSTDSTGAVLIAAPLPTSYSAPARPSPLKSEAPAAAVRQRDGGLWTRLHLAQADNGEYQRAGDDQRASRKMLVQLEEVTVTGTHIRGADNPTAPLIVMDREYIQATGLTTAVQLIESLPQNFALVNQSSAGGVLSGNSSSMTQGASINLRGMGEGTTLTLVNGRRMPLGYDGSAVNIVALPLSAIERVEVLTDGASALYGSDAVGGVVNFVMRKDFDGAESRARVGVADSVDEYRMSQTVGHNWDGGNFVVSAEHYRRDMLMSKDRDFGSDGRTTLASLLPKENNYGVTLFGRQNITGNLDVFVDALYTDRDSINRGAHLVPTSDRVNYVDATQLSATAGLGWHVGPSWRIEFSGGYGEDESRLRFFDSIGTVREGDIPILAKFTGVDVKADGPVLELPGGTLRVAVGGHRREESLDSGGINRNAAGVVTLAANFVKERQVNSFFTEVLVPLIGQANTVPGIERLELSLAGRHDDYSDFGSSTDPRVGLAWMPVNGLKLRGSWGTSYLAPKMKDFDVTFNIAVAVDDYVPANGLHLLAVNGNAPEALKAQESEHYTIGLEWTEFLPGASLAVNYYDIDYRDKIENVSLSFETLISNPAAYGDLFILDPTVEQVNEYIAYGAAGGRPFQAVNANFTPNPNFDPASVDLIVDSRRRNVGVVRSRGFDVAAAYDFRALAGDMRVALDVAYIDEMLKQFTATSAPISPLDTFFNPTHLRLRGHIGYRKGGWSLNGFIHRKNSYRDNRFTPYVKMKSYTTFDLNAAYRFGERDSLLSNTTFAFGATNVLDKDPPPARVRPTTGQFDLGFDPSNASPLGRLIAVDVTKRW